MIERTITLYAKEIGKPLAPGWNAELHEIDLGADANALDTLVATLGWEPAKVIAERPRADQFPLLLFDTENGWAVARQWDSAERLAIIDRSETFKYDPSQRFFSLRVPDPLATEDERAVSIFWRAIRRRKQPLIMAGLATVFANLLTLATSLYSMQLYDRVIPLASFDTLLVLTVGVLFALLLDFALRSLRALLLEREAQDIDAEVSEFFFSRAQAVRLDLRPPGIGTLAAQLRGQEQVRQVLSSGSIFMLADLPFALLFIAVIAMIGGKLALVPIVSLPLAILVALGLARIIRAGTNKAQVSGNRKNGMLVEALDAGETVKANRGLWFMIGRWNRLVHEVHHYEIPVKRASAVAGSLFGTLQQMSYVAIMGWGAYLAATGQITTGALLACSIIAGRINGPLVAQLPNLIVQWGYARSSLNALDAIMALPLDPASGAGALRPDTIIREYTFRDAFFAYPASQRPAVEIDRLVISPGERVVVVGGVGSGKSTLLKLLSGLYSPQQGQILLGGLNLSQIAEDIARREIGYVPQDSRLVNGTLRDNLTMGLADITDNEIMEMAGKTKLDSVVAAQSDGLASPIQEGGKGLSGGQRSLVAINRLLMARPSIWLLDEPTASLDQLTEAAAFSAIEEQLDDKSILVMVSHKPQLLSHFSRILVMSQGKVVRDGPPHEIVKGNGTGTGSYQGTTKADSSSLGTITTKIRKTDI